MLGKKKVNINRESLRLNRLPLLHKDKNWIELFANTEDESIREALNEVVSLEKEERDLENLIRSLKKDKKKSMAMILAASDSINNENKTENIRLLDEYKERLLAINEKLEEVEFRLEIIPQRIREANFNLLNATVQEGYSSLGEKEEELDRVNKELKEINKRLKELVEIKAKNEEWIDGIYTFMHRLLGNDIIDDLDRQAEKWYD